MSDQGDWDDDDPGWQDDGDGYDQPVGPAGDGGRNLSWLVAAAIILLVAVGVGAAVVASGDDDGGGDDTAEVEPSSTTTTRRQGLPGLPGSSTTSTTVVAASSTTTSTTRAAAAPSTTTTMPDGPKEPACAPLVGGGAAAPVADGWQSRWTTKPAPNDPARLSFCVDDRTPKVGQLVTLTAHAADPDAPIPDDQCAVFVSWDGDGASLCFDTATPGVKPTPPEQKGDVVAKRTFTYRGDQVGARRITVTTTSGGGPDRSPYASTATTSLEITVHA